MDPMFHGVADPEPTTEREKVITRERAKRFCGWPDLHAKSAAHQVKLIMQHGLRPEHYVLEVGAGILTVGERLIRYLDDGHYWAVEPNDWLCKTSGVGEEEYHLFTFDDFKLSRIRWKFDYILAHSILTHTDRAQMNTLLSEARKVIRDTGLILFTFYDQRHGSSDHKGWLYPAGCAYMREFVEARAKEAGFDPITFADPAHPIRHTWLFGRPV